MKLFGISLILTTLATISVVWSRPSLPEKAEGKRLIQFTEEGPPVWLTQAEVDEASVSHVNFMDITDLKEIRQTTGPQLYDVPTNLSYSASVQNAQGFIQLQRIETFMNSFTSYRNRYYTSETGVASSSWLYEQLQAIINANGYENIASVQKFTHSWAQPSIIVRINGSANTNFTETGLVVLGAHLDSIASGGASSLAPGADDNASGATTLFEALQALLEAGFKPVYNLEFQWYAAEEVGLRGSSEIVSSYAEAGKEVIGMMNIDMSGYVGGGSDFRIALITDYNDPELTTFVSLLVDEYTNVGWVYDVCGYACSDHASYYRAGYRSSHPFEGLAMSPYLHTSNDVLEYVRYSRIYEFTKLAVGYAIELAEPQPPVE